MVTPLPYNIFDLSLFTAKATPFPSMHRSAGKRQTHGRKVLEGGGGGGGEPFSKKVSLPASFFSSNLQASACRPQNKKNPRRSGDKKDPSRCELQGGLEQSLAAAYFPT